MENFELEFFTLNVSEKKTCTVQCPRLQMKKESKNLFVKETIVTIAQATFTNGRILVVPKNIFVDEDSRKQIMDLLEKELKSYSGFKSLFFHSPNAESTVDYLQ